MTTENGRVLLGRVLEVVVAIESVQVRANLMPSDAQVFTGPTSETTNIGAGRGYAENVQIDL